ncbi:MAG: hypothetical protein K0B07_01620 [DPANN group archaeon]|nr:hypothetical protein [DPANN group archaeon]
MTDTYKEFKLEGPTNLILSDEIYNLFKNIIDTIPKDEIIYQEGPSNNDNYSVKFVIASESPYLTKLNNDFISFLLNNSHKTDISYSATDITDTDCEKIYQGLRLGKTSESNTPHTPDNNIKLTIDSSNPTISEILENYIATGYTGWITCRDLYNSIEKDQNMETIKLSTISTYLSRMYIQGLLERRGNRTQREYQYIHPEE